MRSSTARHTTRSRLAGLSVSLVVGLLCSASAGPALATDWTFNWATLGWTAGSLGPRTYTNVAGSGRDVRVTITNASGAWQSGAPILENSPGQGNELMLHINFPDIRRNTTTITVLIEFFATGTTNYLPATLKGLAIRDIDRNTNDSWKDVMTARGVNSAGTTVDPDFFGNFGVTPTWTAGAGGGTCTGCTTANTINASTGSNISQSDPAGWATINFATKSLRSMSFVYSAGNGNGENNPDAQRVWLSNFVFSDTPITTRAAISGARTYVEAGQPWFEWQTASETGTAGFHVYRKDPTSGAFLRLNDAMLPALIGVPQGGTYRLQDPGLAAGQAATYRLEEVEANGATRHYGPFDVPAAGAEAGPRGRRAKVPFAPDAAGPESGTYQRQAHALAGRTAEPLTAELPSTLARTSAAAPGALAPAARILVDRDGVCVLSASRIADTLGADQKQVGVWIAAGKLRLRQKGHEVAWTPSPAGDAIYFYGQAPQGADAAYTRFNVYLLDRADGLTMKAQHGKTPSPVTGLQPFVSSIHAEENRVAAPFLATDPDADFWYWNFVVADDPALGGRRFVVSAPGAALSGTATIRAYLQGATDLADGNDHHARLLVNGAEVGSETWDGIAPRVLTATFDSSLLASDRDNTVAIRGERDPGVSYSVFWVNGFHLDYPRTYQASGDSLRLTGDENGVVTVRGFSRPTIAVLDISNPLAPRHVASTSVTASSGGWAASFVPADGKTPYVAAVPRPPADVVADSPSTLKEDGAGASYIVITPYSLRAGADILAAYRGGRVVDLQDIYGAFSDGIANPNAIRDFLAFAHASWNPRPRFVALLGKGTFDPKDYLGLGTNLFPVLMTSTPTGLFASDNRFADFDADGVPDVAIGRIPALTVGDVMAYVDKVKLYESDRSSNRQALLMADDPDGTDRSGDFTTDNLEVAGPLAALGFVTKPVSLATTPVLQARAEILETLNSTVGASLANYVGHGGVNVLADEALLSNHDVAGLVNRSNLPLFAAFTCAVGNGTYPGWDSLTEALLWRRGGGAVAAFAPTALADARESHVLNLGLVDELFGPSAKPTLGEAALAALAGLARQGGSPYMLGTHSVFGDPALQVHK